MSLTSEIHDLFPPDAVERSKTINPGQVDARAVQVAAGALLLLGDEPAEQVALVRAFRPDVAAALCRWVSDPGFWALVSQVVKH